MTPGRLTIWIAAFSTVLLGAARAPIYVGVLEAPVDDARGDFHVRVAFRFEDGQWSAMPHGVADQDALAKLAAKFPRQVSWTIALHGKRLGQLSTTRPLAYSLYADVGLEDLAPSSKPPAIQEGAAAFATWMGAARYRPLLAISEPNYDDPDHWAPYDAPPAMRKQALAAFRRKIALDPNCDGKSTRSYPDSAIQIYGTPHRSTRGDVLIAMRPDPRLNRCDGPAGDEWQSVWFHSRGDNYHWIGNSLTLLDIGDYNGDGGAKILFQYDGYNRDGYLLLDPRDDSRIEFSWSYH
jgi:hypothetical protein